MTGKLTTYTALAVPAAADIFPLVDVDDFSLAPTGTDKIVTLQNLLVGQGLQFLTGGGVINSTTITTAISAGFQGIFLDPRFVWDMSGLAIHGISNFVIESRMVGSIGYSGNISYNSTGYIKTDTGSPVDGVQVYANTASESTQGIIFRGLAFVGTNSNAVFHLGGGQRRIFVEDCFIHNTATAGFGATVNAGNGTAINNTNFSGSQSITVTSTTGYFNGAGTIFVQCLIGSAVGIACFSYNGTTSTTFQNCQLLSSYTGATLSTASGSNEVLQACMAMSDDTGIEGYNSEDQTFSHVSMASDGGVAMGLNVNNVAQKDNDTIWNDCATSSGGLCSLAALGGGGHNFYNYYDRTKASVGPGVATVWNDGSTLIFRGGEDQCNSTTGVSHFVDGGTTVIDSRNLTQATSPAFGTTALLVGGLLVFLGHCTANNGSGQANANTVNVLGGVLDISSEALNMGNLRVLGSGGQVFLASNYGQYNPPNVSGYTGNVQYPQGLGEQAGTPLAGHALVNGTGTIISWTAPNDGQMHSVTCAAVQHITSAETAGSVQMTFNAPDGTSTQSNLFPGGSSTLGITSTQITRLIAPNSTATVQQNSALTGGAATVWAQLWGA